MTSVRIEHVSKSFGQTVALRDVDLTINAGEIFFLLGPSGCGKSTLLRIIAGLHEPTSGRVFFNDRDVTGLPTQQRNAVMCFQSYALWPHMSVRENVRFGLDVRNIPRAAQDQRIDEVLRLVHMETYTARKPNELSGGQQQRVALARALVVKPDCLLLDEPLSNLDAKLRLDMRTEIRRICRQAGLTAIYVTHDQKEALSIADRMAILDAGRIAQLGPSQEVYLRPQTRFIANFMGETNFLPGTVQSVNSHAAIIQTPIGDITSASLPQSPLAAGQSVTLSIRPEVLHLGAPPADAANTFPAAVHNTVYLGEMAQHQVRVGPAAKPLDLKAFELNPKFVARDDAVHQTQVWFSPGDVVTLAE
ncbi:MAG: ABC transporter ATP-binding protein [Opitutales bacterium]